MTIDKLLSIFNDSGCGSIYVKRLSPNDNSKNQVYLSGSFDILNIIKFQEIITDTSSLGVRDRFKAKVNFLWISDDYNLYHAPYAQLILYPKYPEVRLSGFLRGCKHAPSEIMATRIENRLLFFSTSNNGQTIAYATTLDSEVGIGYKKANKTNFGLFEVIELKEKKSTKIKLLSELKRIYEQEWIYSKRLNKSGLIVDCNAPNCGGYTLEAELGIIPNGNSEPDFLGWEIKQFGVKGFQKLSSSIITLMTPEPKGGFYGENGARDFIDKYGYADTQGRDNRKNFGGIFKNNAVSNRTKLTLKIAGYNLEKGIIEDADGGIILVDNENNIAAKWYFTSILSHWNKKHNLACYIPSMSEKDPKKYKYGDKVLLCEETDFLLFVKQLANSIIYYDPALKIENGKIKTRNQFRIKYENIPTLYKSSELVSLIP